MTIDAWMQHPNRRFLADPMFDSPLRRWSHDNFPAKVSTQWTLDQMDRAGVEVGLLCAWWAPTGPLISNDEVGQLALCHPDRFVPVASADLYRPMDAVREVRRCVDAYGVRAVRIVPWLWNLPPDDRRYYPLLPSAATWT